MYVQAIVVLLSLYSVSVSNGASSNAVKLIENICDSLEKTNDVRHSDDHKWRSICRKLFHSKHDDRDPDERIQHILAEHDMLNNSTLSRTPRRGSSGGGRGGGGGSRGGSSIRGGSSSGSRSSGSRSFSTFRSTRTGSSISRPTGWQWSRSRFIFLPIATRYGYRSRSSSNRYTTSATNALTYYYCTSNDNASVEIQCSSANNDSQCCEDGTTQEVFCCGGDIPDDLQEELNRATQLVARIFYTLSALAFCMHICMRLSYRS